MASVSPGDIGIIILAAGSSRRFGADKRFAILDTGNGILETTLARVPAILSRRLLVLHPGDESLARRFHASGWNICIARDATRGMGHSLAAGVRAAAHWQGAIIGLGDMPFVLSETYSAIQIALACHKIVIPTLNGRRGNPVGFRRNYFGELSGLSGDVGAKSLLQKYEEDCWLLACSDEGILTDIDRQEAIG